MTKITNIAIFASGSGTNADNIIKYFDNNDKINVATILCNNKNAGVIDVARKNNVEALVFDKQNINDQKYIPDYLKSKNIGFIVLAGFLWLIPNHIINIYPRKIINIHPALLPKYGGKGMYGNNVHKEVLRNKETETGITIHYVNEKYDQGDIIFQTKTKINPEDSIQRIAEKVHKLEYEHFPKIIEKLILSL